MHRKHSSTRNAQTRKAKARQSGPPRLTSIELENFKSLERIKLTVPEPISTNPEREHPSHAAALLVLGENASGKSSLLESVALALCGEAVRTNIGKSAAVFILDPNLMGANGERKPAYSSVTLKFDYSNENKLIMENDFHEDFQVLHTPPVLPMAHLGSTAQVRSALCGLDTLAHFSSLA